MSAGPASLQQERLIEWRSEFPSLEGCLHFISHSLGAMPREAEESLRRYTVSWKARSIRSWEEESFELPMALGQTLARLLHAEPGSVSIHPNVSLAEAVALSALDMTPPRNRVVCLEEDFPSVLYLYEGLSRRGVEVVRVPAREARRIAEEDVVRAVDERTAVVAISHVLFRTSQMLDLGPIVSRAREVGALTLVDAYQSVGTAPVDVQAMGVDMLAGGSVKWLCGGPGLGYLYVSPRVAGRLRHTITGWMAHARPFDFDPGPMQWDEGARRFHNGTTQIPALLAARPGIEMVAGIGAERIRAKSLRQTERMISWADEYGLRLVSPREPERRGGTVVLDAPRADAVCRALLAEDVLLDFRPGVGLRLAPHFYTRDDEVDLVMRRVRDEAGKAP
jgi:kynureninase